MKKYNFTLSDVNACLQLKSWWAALFILPFARRVTLFIANYTDIKPNTITSSSFVFVLLSAWCFFKGSYNYILLGALFFEINYLFDCVDGTIARLKKLQSFKGEVLDWLLDRFRIIITVVTLGYGQYKIQNSVLPLILSFIYLGLNNLILLSRAFQFRILNRIGSKDINNKGAVLLEKTTNKILLKKWLNFTHKRNLMPYYHDIETDAIIFVIGPLFNIVNLCLITGSILSFILIVILNILFVKSLNVFLNNERAYY